MTINIIDTPGHADFGGEVERGLSMVDGIVLLVDASEGPLPQTRFVLRKALNADLPVVLVVNKVDRVGRADRRGGRRDLRAVHRPARREPQPGRARLPRGLRLRHGRPGQHHDARERRDARLARTSSRCSRRSWTPSRRRSTTRSAPLQAHVTNLDASPFLGRLALVRVKEGHLKKGQQVAWMRRDGTTSQRQDHRAAGHRGPGAQARPRGGPRRHRRDRRDARHHDRRDAGRPGEPGGAAADHRRRAGHLDDDRHQHLPARRPGEGLQGHRAAGQGPARRRARRQRVDPGPADRAPGRLGGAGPRRAGAGHPGRADAPRGLRADRRQAAGGHPRGQRQAARAGRAADDRRAGGVPRHDHPAARGPQGPDGADDQPRHRLGADGVPGPGARA